MILKARVPLREGNKNRFPVLSSLIGLIFLQLSVGCQASLGPRHGQFTAHSRKRTNNPPIRTTSNLLHVIRGGQQPQQPSDPYNNNNGQQQYPSQPYNDYAPNDYDAPPPPQSYNDDGFANVNAGSDQMFQETVQDRVDKWRIAQMEKSKTYTAAQAANPRDEQGRFKLMSSVSKGSRALIFFVLMWRDIHLYEVADQRFKGNFRLLTVVPLTCLFIGNLAGVIGSLTSPGHAAKKRLKAVLNLDKLVEIFLLCVYFIRLTILPSKYTPREIYISGMLHSVFFLIQCQAFTRVTWDEITSTAGAKPVANTAYPPRNDNEASRYQQAAGTSQYQQTGGPYEINNEYDANQYSDNQGYQTASYNPNN